MLVVLELYDTVCEYTRIIEIKKLEIKKYS
jgi:hypothetical protein